MDLHGLTAMFSSTAYVGIPLLLIAYGDSAIVPGLSGSRNRPAKPLRAAG